MDTKYHIFSFLFVLVALMPSMNSCASVNSLGSYNVYNPIDFGINEAHNDIERYWVLYTCHSKAKENNRAVSYKGIDTLFLEVPPTAKSIPLSSSTDFCGATIIVKNNNKNIYLFNFTEETKAIDVSPWEIDSKIYKEGSIKKGTHLLIIEDSNPWVNNRKGYSYGAQRRDVILLRNGIGRNHPIMPYNNSFSRPIIKYTNPTTTKYVFRNINFIRSGESTKITYLVLFENLVNVEVTDIHIETINNHNLFGDAAITARNIAGLTLARISIDGTYSLQKEYGYGFCLDNIYDLKVNDVVARAEWGIFGNNNINKATLTNCDINRFDIHCYGRDVLMSKCCFSNLYNQFSSTYGKISFNDCVFTHFTPVLIENSYNAYTPFDLEWNNCVFNLDKKHYSLVALLGLSKEINSRKELSRKCIPNVKISSCIVNADGIKQWYIINTGDIEYGETIDYVSNITIDGLIMTNDTEMKPFSQKVNTTNRVDVSLKRIVKKNQ